jgi:ParB family chromosome partitioning protein
VSQLSLFGAEVSNPATAAPAAPAKKPVVKGKLLDLDIAGLQPDPQQPRKYFDAQALAELQTSILRHGVLQPILVRKGGEGAYIIVSGERRFQAASKAGLAKIPAILTDGNPAEIAIIENLMRENLTAIEEAEGIERLRALNDYQLSDLSAILGKSVSLLSEILSLNRLPDEVKDDCRRDPKSSRGVLVEIARQRDPQKMAAIYYRYRESGLTRGEIRKKSAGPKKTAAPFNPGFIASCSERLDRLDSGRLTAGQQESLQQELEKLRSVVNRRLKELRLKPENPEA